MTALIPLLSALLLSPQISPTPEYTHPRLVLQEGDVAPGGGGRPVTFVSGPVQDGLGTVGLGGSIDDGLGNRDSFLWEKDSIFLQSSQVGMTGFNGRVFGIGLPQDTVKRPYAVAANDPSGPRVLLSHQGIVMRAGMTAPGLPASWRVTDIRNLEMLPNGALAWSVLYVKNTGGQGTAQYFSSDATAQNVTKLFRDGNTVDGAVIKKLGLAYDWDVSDSGEHHVQVMRVKPEGQPATFAVYVDGKFALYPGDSAGGGETWEHFTWVATNDKGQLINGGEIDAPESTNNVLAHKGQVVQREGGFVDGVLLAAPAEVAHTHLNNDGAAIYLWAVRGSVGPYAIFYTPDIDDFSTTRHVVSEGAPLDLDGDGNAEATLNQFRFDGGPAIAWGPGGKSIYIAAKIRYGATVIDGVIEYPIP